MTPRFTIGTRFQYRGKAKHVGTITDILTTYNSKGELVKIRYVATHQGPFNLITDYDVGDATVAIGIVELRNSEAREAGTKLHSTLETALRS